MSYFAMPIIDPEELEAHLKRMYNRERPETMGDRIAAEMHADILRDMKASYAVPACAECPVEASWEDLNFHPSRHYCDEHVVQDAHVRLIPKPSATGRLAYPHWVAHAQMLQTITLPWNGGGASVYPIDDKDLSKGWRWETHTNNFAAGQEMDGGWGNAPTAEMARRSAEEYLHRNPHDPTHP
jgi:hypothetical protein